MSSFMSLESDPHVRAVITRRDVLTRAAHGFGALALQYLLEREGLGAVRVNPLAPKAPHFAAKAKSVIFLYMVGAPSHIDTFDPKPALKKYEGQQLPESFGKVTSQFNSGHTPLLSSPWAFKKYGQSGIEVSSLFRHLAECVDDICFVRSFYTESVVHAPAMYQVHTGRILMGYPSMGSWITYGLGSESDNLPSYVVMPQPEGTPEAYGGFRDALPAGSQAGRARRTLRASLFRRRTHHHAVGCA